MLIDWPKTNVEARNAQGRKPADDGGAEGPQALVAQADRARRRRQQAGLGAAALRRHRRARGDHAAAAGEPCLHRRPVAQRHDAADDGRACTARPAAVKLLLEEGADTSLNNELGLTALDFAQRGNRRDAAEMIAEAMRRARTKRQVVTTTCPWFFK